ncbi:hypothetical protein MASR2M70_01930 [Bacillota bacterium]
MKEWVWNIFIMTASLAFIELVMPSGSIQKYLKFIFSLFILAVIIYPIGHKAMDEMSVVMSVKIEGRGSPENKGDEMLQRLLGTQTRQIEEIYQEKHAALKGNASSVQNPGISLTLTDIYSNDKEEPN